MTRTDKSSQIGERGFTLIEMAVVIMVIGLIIATAAPIYQQYRADVATQRTAQAVNDVSEAIGGFVASRGRYPCPAPLTATIGNPAYGHEEASCRASPQDPFTVIPVGTCVGGICAQQSIAARTYDHDNNVATAQVQIPVRIGAVPFRALGLQEEDSLDGQHNRLFYIVTQPLAAQATYSNDLGGIDIVKDNGASELGVAGSGHFLVFSAGRDSAGAFTYEGVQTPCPAGTAQGQNCDLTQTDAVFTNLQRSDAAGNQKFDDIMSWSSMSGTPQWQIVDNDKANGITPDIRQVAGGNVGLSVPVGTDLSAPNVHVVDGQVRVSDEAYAQEICKEDSGRCFPPSLVGEDNPADYVPGERGIKCPVGFVEKISNNVATCISVIEFGCVQGQILKRFNPDGSPVCAPAPSARPCAAGRPPSMQACIPSLPLSPHNTVLTLTGGSCRTETWRCNDSRWTRTAATGRCTFNANPTTTACGACWTGTQTSTPRCIGAATVDRSACRCDAASCGPTAKSLSCQSNEVRALGYTGEWQGSISQTRTFSCPVATAAPVATAWNPPPLTNTDVTSNCTCPATKTVHVACPPGHTGYGQDITYGMSQSGKNCGVDLTDVRSSSPPAPDCSCAETIEYRDPDCPDNYYVVEQERRQFSCSLNKWGDWSPPDPRRCAPITCTWKRGTPAGSDSFGRNPVGGNCTCGSSPSQCSSPGAGSSYNIYDDCQCTGSAPN